MAGIPTMLSGRLRGIKGQARLPSQDERRKKLLQEQAAKREARLQQKRSERLQTAAENVMQSPPIEESLPHPERRSDRIRRIRAEKRRLVSQLSHLEWLLEIPADLGPDKGDEESGWMVFPRPEGKACLVLAHRGRVIVRDKHGTELAQFVAPIPGGSPHSSGFSALEAIFDEERRILFAFDILHWHAAPLWECQFRTRCFWLQSRLQELDQTHSPYELQALPVFNCDAEGLGSACHMEVNFRRDGIVFAHCAAPYVSGATPFSLLFKTPSISRFTPSDTHTSSSEAVLEVSDSMELQTFDGVSLVSMDSATVAHFGFAPLDLVRVSFAEAGVNESGTPALLEPRIQGNASPRRIFPDLWSRILFFEARRRRRGGLLSVPPHISLEDLAAAVSSRGSAAVPTPQVRLGDSQPHPAVSHEGPSGGGSMSMGVGHMVAQVHRERQQGAEVPAEDDDDNYGS